MDNARATLTLYPKRSSAMWLLLACSAFVAIGIWMGLDGDWVGWLCAGFFGLGLPIAIVQLIPGSTYLKLTPSGFAYSNLFRVTAVSWSDVDEFFVVEQAGVGVHRMVGFNFRLPTIEPDWDAGSRVPSETARAPFRTPMVRTSTSSLLS